MYHTTLYQTLHLTRTPRHFSLRTICQSLRWLMVFFGFTHLAAAQTPSVLWQKALGGTNNDYAYAMTAISDGGSVVAGYTESNNGDVSGNHGGTDVWVVKLDASGNKVWQKTLGGSNREFAHAVTTTLDGGYVVAGFTESNDGDVSGNHGVGTADFWVVKLDGNGNTIWQKTLGGTGPDVAHGVKATPDGGYVVAGYTYSNDGDVTGNHGTDDFWVVKLDGNGNKIWQKTLGGSKEDRAAAITVTSDGGYVLAGHTYSNDGNVTGFHNNSSTEPDYFYPDYWVVKLDGAGNLVWQKALGGSSIDYAEAVIAAADGSYAVAGFTYSNNGDVTGNHLGGSSDYWLVKLDGSGNLLWQKALGGQNQDDCYAMTATADGGYVLAGNSNSTNGDVTGNHGGSDAWVVKVDGSGNLVWQKSLGGSKDDRALAVTVTADGGYAVASQTLSNDGDVTGNHGAIDFWVVRLGLPCTSVQSGDWANPATWSCGHEPTVNDLVTISLGHVVTVSTNSAQAQRININGGTIRYVNAAGKIFVKGE